MEQDRRQGDHVRNIGRLDQPDDDRERSNQIQDPFWRSVANARGQIGFGGKRKGGIKNWLQVSDVWIWEAGKGGTHYGKGGKWKNLEKS